MFETFVNIFPETSPEIQLKVVQYYELLLKWNKSLNLVQKNTLEKDVFESRHLIDCWQLTRHLDKAKPVLDVGSGAGLPGILLSIAGFAVHLVELDASKSSFLKNCKAHLGLNCSILTVDVYSITEPYTQVTSRAFSQLSSLLEVQSNVSRETKGVFLKGYAYEEEVKQAQEKWAFDLHVIQSLSSPDGKILITSNVSEI